MGGRKPAASLLAPLLAALLLLTGCGAPAGEDPPPSDSAATPAPAETALPQVSVHWDALTQAESLVSTASRLSEDWMDDFAPGAYGGVTPYIGGEQRVMYGYLDEDGSPCYETRYLYGLSTAEGLLLTDPVFNSVYRLTCYDQLDSESKALPVWIVSRTDWDAESAEDEWTQGYYSAVGLLAADGSWYTGCRFRMGVSSTIAVGNKSVLMMESADSAVLISLADGSELARYSPYDFTGPEDPNGVAEWLFSDGLAWGMLCCCGDYFYCYPISANDDPIWIDGATGAFLDEAPMEFPEPAYEGTRRIFFDGGWYEDDGLEYSAGGELVLHYDGGREEAIPLTGELGSLFGVSAENLLFWKAGADGESFVYTITDHVPRALRTVDGVNASAGFLSDSVTGRTYLYVAQPTEADSSVWRYTLLDGQAEDQMSCINLSFPSDGLMAAVDETFYRLVDVSDGCREIFRIPRWEALDLPPDD